MNKKESEKDVIGKELLGNPNLIRPLLKSEDKTVVDPREKVTMSPEQHKKRIEAQEWPTIRAIIEGAVKEGRVKKMRGESPARKDITGKQIETEGVFKIYIEITTEKMRFKRKRQDQK